MKGTAKRIKDTSNDRADAALYHLDPPIEDYERSFEFVVVSATHVFGEPETYIFGADSDGTIVLWSELEGSQKGTLQHHAALTDAGYEVVT